jgi:hypothetical protein
VADLKFGHYTRKRNPRAQAEAYSTVADLKFGHYTRKRNPRVQAEAYGTWPHESVRYFFR